VLLGLAAAPAVLLAFAATEDSDKWSAVPLPARNSNCVKPELMACRERTEHAQYNSTNLKSQKQPVKSLAQMCANTK
jgi:hypothetical protein